jgi:uncharacterized protein YjbJ (UPF0337 family)
MKSSGSTPGNIIFCATPSRKLAIRAVHGNVIPLKRQQHQVMDSADRFNGKWKHHVGIARIVWGELSVDELLLTAGRKEDLAGLIQQRYSMSLTAANDQVERVIEKCGF